MGYARALTLMASDIGASAVNQDVKPGIVTLLFTDIEGSTEKWEQEPERMADALARHDVLLRAAVEAHRGRVIKTTGDGIYAVFADAADCVETAIAIQQSVADPAATAGMPLSVRCGLHAGPALERDDDFFGGTINRAARIMGLAYGGQVLASQAVADLVADRLPAGSSLRDLGGVRLKGIASVEHVYQVVHPGLRQEFPALRSLEVTPNNLPQHLTSFIGREREIGKALVLLKRARLLTLLGIGGLGKTRLSLQIAGDVLDSYRDGAWFVDLAPLRDPTVVASEAAKVLGVREEPGRSLIETLCAHLKPRNLLLIMDNCEHLIGASAELVHAILRTAPEVRIIATSREALRVPGEETFAVPPLPVPNRSDGIEALSRSAAVRLFVERAKLHRPTFALNEQEAPALAELVARLEGIPLALELAAARVGTLTVADINVRLKDRYKLLTGGGRVLLERQQTLRALVDWSHDLLQEPEQALLARLAVFAGGFELAAAEEIGGADPLVPEDVLNLLTSLVEKSLVLTEERVVGTRFRMLETIRDYAREKLTQRNELTATAARHCEYYFQMAKDARDGMDGPEQAASLTRFETELDNIRAATALALAGDVDPVIAVKLVVAMQGFWIMRGYFTEGRRLANAALELPAVESSSLAKAHALYVGAALAWRQADHAEARRMFETSLAIRRELGDPVAIAATLSSLSMARLQAGDASGARKDGVEAIEIFRRLGDRVGEAIGFSNLGQIALYETDYDGARTHLNAGLLLARKLEIPETVIPSRGRSGPAVNSSVRPSTRCLLKFFSCAPEGTGPGVVRDLRVVEVCGQNHANLGCFDRNLPLGSRGVPAQDRVVALLPGVVPFPEDGALDVIAQAITLPPLDGEIRATDPDAHQIFFVRDRAFVSMALAVADLFQLDSQRVTDAYPPRTGRGSRGESHAWPHENPRRWFR